MCVFERPGIESANACFLFSLQLLLHLILFPPSQEKTYRFEILPLVTIYLGFHIPCIRVYAWALRMTCCGNAHFRRPLTLTLSVFRTLPFHPHAHTSTHSDVLKWNLNLVTRGMITKLLAVLAAIDAGSAHSSGSSNKGSSRGRRRSSLGIGKVCLPFFWNVNSSSI